VRFFRHALGLWGEEQPNLFRAYTTPVSKVRAVVVPGLAAVSLAVFVDPGGTI
jgi:hypothetical protein